MSRARKNKDTLAVASGPAPLEVIAETDEAADGRPSGRLSGAAKRNTVTVVIAGVLLVVVTVAGGQAARPVITEGTVSQTFSQGQPCATAAIPIVVGADADPAQLAQTLFDTVKSVPGVNSATYYLKTSVLEVGFCESKASEAVVRQILAPTGLVDAAPAQAPSPEVEAGAASAGADPGVLVVETSSGSYSPSRLTAKAGKPIEILFGQASGCMAEVVFPDLNIRQSLVEGPATIKLPALKPGTYEFACGMDMQRGTLVVE